MQTFKLHIDAESTDGRAVKSHIAARIDCERSMAISLMAKVMEQDEAFKEIVTQALVICITGEKFSETMSNEEYDDYTSNDVEL